MQCPGQDNRYWSGEAVFNIPCPHCGNELEFFKDDSQRLCKRCGHRVLNPKIDFGCASYCPYAEQCMGSLPAELRTRQGNLFKDKLTIAVRKQLVNREDDFRLVAKRAEYGEALCQHEGGNTAAIVAAALLSKTENPLSLLLELAAEDTLIQEVKRLLHTFPAVNEEQSAIHNKQAQSTAIFHDACLLSDMNLHLLADQTTLCLTLSGKREAEKIQTTMAQ